MRLNRPSMIWRPTGTGRVDVRLLGPMAPYDFVSTSQPGSELT